MTDEQAKDLMTCVGAMAEITALYFRGLIENGLTIAEASALTGEFIKTLLHNK